MDEINKAQLWVKLENERRRRKRKLVKIVFFVCLFLFVAIVSFLFFSEHSLKSLVLSPFLGKKRINVIVAGLDAREHDVGRTDTLMMITIDPETKKAYQLAIPRDTRVLISDMKPPDNWDKINAANAYGGPEVTKRTVEEFLGVKIDYWLDLRFKSFADAINDLGGLTIDVEKSMHYEDPYDDDGGLVINFAPGVQHLDGKQAIEYVRYRDSAGDIGRVERQSRFIKALLDQVSTPGGMTKLPGVVKKIYGELNTDMPMSLMLSLVAILPEVKQNGVDSEMVPGTPLYIDGVSYWIPDIVKMREMVARIEGITTTADYLEEANKLTELYATSLPDASHISYDGEPSKKTVISPDNNDKAELSGNKDNEKANDTSGSNTDSNSSAAAVKSGPDTAKRGGQAANNQVTGTSTAIPAVSGH